MPGRGYLFALDVDEVRLATGCATGAALGSLLEGLRAGTRTAELDKAWVFIDRCLSAGQAGPLASAVLGGRPLLKASDRVATLVPAELVDEVATALDTLDEATFRARFEATATAVPDGESEELDLLYAWGWFQRLRALYRQASAEHRAVLFAGELTPGAWATRAEA